MPRVRYSCLTDWRPIYGPVRSYNYCKQYYIVYYLPKPTTIISSRDDGLLFGLLLLLLAILAVIATISWLVVGNTGCGDYDVDGTPLDMNM